MDYFSFAGSAHCGGIDSLIVNALNHLKGLGYSPGTVANYRNTWKEFQLFVQNRIGEEAFSTDMVHQFLDSQGVSLEKAEAGLTLRQRHVRAVMRVLTEFALHGCFQLCGRRKKEVKLTTEMRNILCDYEQFCREHLKSSIGSPFLPSLPRPQAMEEEAGPSITQGPLGLGVVQQPPPEIPASEAASGPRMLISRCETLT